MPFAWHATSAPGSKPSQTAISDPKRPKTLFIRSGGGLPGLDIHLGLWLALETAGIESTHCAGTSAGAVISALDSCGYSSYDSASLLARLRDNDVRQPRRLWKFRLPWIHSIMRSDKIAQLLEDLLPGNFEAYKKPLSIWATRAHDWQKINVFDPLLSPDPALSVLASLSISGFFPAVHLSDRSDPSDPSDLYFDGGPRANLPLPPDWPIYDQVWLLIASPPPLAYQGECSALTNLIRNVHVLAYDQLADALEQTAGAANVHVLWPPLRPTCGVLHFDHALIEQAREYAELRIARILAATSPDPSDPSDPSDNERPPR